MKLLKIVFTLLLVFVSSAFAYTQTIGDITLSYDLVDRECFWDNCYFIFNISYSGNLAPSEIDLSLLNLSDFISNSYVWVSGESSFNGLAVEFSHNKSYTIQVENGTRYYEGSNRSGLNLADFNSTHIQITNSSGVYEIPKTSVWQYYAHNEDGWLTSNASEPTYETQTRYTTVYNSTLFKKLTKGNEYKIKIIGNYDSGFQKNISVDVIPTLKINSLDFELVELAWFNSSWSHRSQITINSSHVNQNVSGFPVFVNLSRLDNTFWTNVNTTGLDIVVTKSDGTTKVAREIVDFDKTNKLGELWFNATYNQSADAIYYIYFGNPNANEDPLNRSLWWDLKYRAKGVWHFSENSTIDNTMADSSPSFAHFSPADNDSYSEIDARIRKGRETTADGLNDVANAANDSAFFRSSDVSVSFWIRNTDSSFQQFSDGCATNSGWFVEHGGGKFTTCNIQDYDFTYNPGAGGAWEFVVVTFDSLFDARLYVNGTLNETIEGNNGAGTSTDAVQMGATDLASRTDELRYYVGTLDANWIKDEYRTVAEDTKFLSVGASAADNVQPSITEITFNHSFIGSTPLYNLTVTIDDSDELDINDWSFDGLGTATTFTNSSLILNLNLITFPANKLLNITDTAALSAKHGVNLNKTESSYYQNETGTNTLATQTIAYNITYNQSNTTYLLNISWAISDPTNGAGIANQSPKNGTIQNLNGSQNVKTVWTGDWLTDTLTSWFQDPHQTSEVNGTSYVTRNISIYNNNTAISFSSVTLGLSNRSGWTGNGQVLTTNVNSQSWSNITNVINNSKADAVHGTRTLSLVNSSVLVESVSWFQQNVTLNNTDTDVNYTNLKLNFTKFYNESVYENLTNDIVSNVAVNQSLISYLLNTTSSPLDEYDSSQIGSCPSGYTLQSYGCRKAVTFSDRVEYSYLFYVFNNNTDVKSFNVTYDIPTDRLTSFNIDYITEVTLNSSAVNLNYSTSGSNLRVTVPTNHR